MGNIVSAIRSRFPPPPAYTEKDIPPQTGRVFIVTGGYAGCGLELVKMLYHAGGRIYIAGRSRAKAEAAIEDIRQGLIPEIQHGTGELFFLPLDLADLASVRPAAEQFLAAESRLDVIWHNAGIMLPASGSVTEQGFDSQLGVNALGPFLFQHFLTPLCLATAAVSDTPKASVRVVWVSSNAHSGSPAPDGVNWDDLNMNSGPAADGLPANLRRYGQSKAMNVMHAHELARRHCEDGLVSVSLHPGALSTGLQGNLPWFLNMLFAPTRYPPRYGALTEAYAGLSSDISAKMLDLEGGINGGHILPWGRIGEGAEHVFSGLKDRKTGEKLWKVCEELLKDFV